jgi:hypothetical protein
MTLRHDGTSSETRNARSLRSHVGANSDPAWPRPMSRSAYHGLLGHIVDRIEPETEADPANLLVSVLTAFGNSIGRHAFIRVGATKHYANEFVALVGPTAAARKGTGWDQVQELFSQLDRYGRSQGRHNPWVPRIKQGLSTGEGLISHAAISSDGDTQLDSRLMILEPELARVLAVMSRPDNTLSSIIRTAWETGTLSILTRNNPLEVTDAHISFIGHITLEELTRNLTATEKANGFANRFLFMMVKRSKALPFGGSPVDFSSILPQLHRAQAAAKRVGEIQWASSARGLWEAHYEGLTARPPGMYGALTSRAAPHVLRLAIIYALLEERTRIRAEHLSAALEVWRYSEDSSRFIFGDSLGSDTADAILKSLRRFPDGISRKEIFEGLFSKNKNSADISRGLDLLERYGFARATEIRTGGRPKELWRAI